MKSIGTFLEEPLNERGLIAGQIMWPRFNRYKAKYFGIGAQSPVGNRKLHIGPTNDAKIEWYRPYDHALEIVFDYLELAQSLQRIGPGAWNERDARKNRYLRTAHLYGSSTMLTEEQMKLKISRIIDFCMKYGLLGLYFERIAYLVGYQYTPYYNRRLAVQEYHKEPAFKFGPTANYFFEHVPMEKVLRMAGRIIKPHEKHQEAFWHGYSEWAKWIEDDASSFLHMFNIWDKFFSSQQSPKDISNPETIPENQRSWQDYLQRLTMARAAAITVSYNRNWQIEYVFDSLSSAIRLLFIQNIISKERIKACKECGAPFTSRHPKAQYCSKSHEHRARQRRFINKQKDKKPLPDSPEKP